MTLEDLMFYELSIRGKYDSSLDAKVLGSLNNFCTNNTCSFKNIQGK